jgi:hypothetical protein
MLLRADFWEDQESSTIAAENTTAIQEKITSSPDGSENSSTSCCEHPDTLQEYSCKSTKARRQKISPNTSSLLRKVKTG